MTIKRLGDVDVEAAWFRAYLGYATDPDSSEQAADLALDAIRNGDADGMEVEAVAEASVLIHAWEAAWTAGRAALLAEMGLAGLRETVGADEPGAVDEEEG